MLQTTMIIEGNKIIKEEISVNQPKETLFFITFMSLRNRTAESVCETNLTELLLASFSVILLLNITVFWDPFFNLPGKLLLFTFQLEVLIVLQINMVKLSVNKTKWPVL